MMEIRNYQLNERDFLHDLATPLMILNGHLELLKKKYNELDDTERQLKLDKCLHASEKLNHLLNERRRYVKSLTEEK